MLAHAWPSKLLATLAALASGFAFAVTPISPRFTADTRTLLIQQLDRAKIPSVGHNSVSIAILRALGAEPRDASAEYDEPYPHLPKVSVSAQLQESRCVRVSALVRGVDTRSTRVRVTGTFCMVGQAQWASADARAVPADNP